MIDYTKTAKKTGLVSLRIELKRSMKKKFEKLCKKNNTDMSKKIRDLIDAWVNQCHTGSA